MFMELKPGCQFLSAIYFGARMLNPNLVSLAVEGDNILVRPWIATGQLQVAPFTRIYPLSVFVEHFLGTLTRMSCTLTICAAKQTGNPQLFNDAIEGIMGGLSMCAMWCGDILMLKNNGHAEGKYVKMELTDIVWCKRCWRWRFAWVSCNLLGVSVLHVAVNYISYHHWLCVSNRAWTTNIIARKSVITYWVSSCCMLPVLMIYPTTIVFVCQAVHELLMLLPESK